MRKIYTFTLGLLILLSLAACASSADVTKPVSTKGYAFAQWLSSYEYPFNYPLSVINVSSIPGKDTNNIATVYVDFYVETDTGYNHYYTDGNAEYPSVPINPEDFSTYNLNSPRLSSTFKVTEDVYVVDGTGYTLQSTTHPMLKVDIVWTNEGEKITKPTVTSDLPVISRAGSAYWCTATGSISSDITKDLGTTGSAYYYAGMLIAPKGVPV